MSTNNESIPLRNLYCAKSQAATRKQVDNIALILTDQEAERIINTKKHAVVDALKDIYGELNPKVAANWREIIYPKNSANTSRAEAKLQEINDMFDNVLLEGRTNGTFIFADLCFAPGGFVKFYREHGIRPVTGFGLTLPGERGLRINHSWVNKALDEGFHFRYILGDIKNPDDNAIFDRLVHTTKVHVVVADGGFSVEGRENNQEHESFDLIFAECLAALRILAVGGTFLCKFFDISLPQTIALVHLMTRYFVAVRVIKPTASRAINSEKYLLFYDFHGDQTLAHEYASLQQGFTILTNIPKRLQSFNVQPEPEFMFWLERVCGELLDAQETALREFIDQCHKL